MSEHGAKAGVTEPWQFFWLTGGLSSFLDNAPTYVTFATLAEGDNFGALAANRPLILAAISCGAVFMGANSYIGNGPNFLVKAIAESHGYPMPSFFGYMVQYVLPVLLPVFAVLTWVFLRDGSVAWLGGGLGRAAPLRMKVDRPLHARFHSAVRPASSR